MSLVDHYKQIMTLMSVVSKLTGWTEKEIEDLVAQMESRDEEQMRKILRSRLLASEAFSNSDRIVISILDHSQARRP
jgi:hypothetical protein